jgi:ribosome biogenesis SPOUT family RNA methylase Rps3
VCVSSLALGGAVLAVEHGEDLRRAAGVVPNARAQQREEPEDAGKVTLLVSGGVACPGADQELR